MTIAEELAVNAPRSRPPKIATRVASMTLDSLDALETLDWSTDPWDDAEVAGVVERLRWQTRSIKWVAYAAMVLVIVLILAAGGVGWWYIHQLNPEGETGDPASFTVDAADTLDSLSERLEQDGFIVDAGVFRWYVERHGGLEITPGYYEITTERPHGQRAGVAAHAARADVQQGHVPRGLHHRRRWPSASTRRSSR